MALSLLLILTLTLSLLTQPSLSSSSQGTITITPRNPIPKSNTPISIHWSGITSPSKLDWLGIYSPPNSTHSNFIGYLYLSSAPTWASGSGSLTIPLTNLRSDYEFRIFRYSDTKKHDHDHNPIPGPVKLLARSERVGFETGRGPEQVHLAYTDAWEEMRVMFVTEDGEARFVRYGSSEDDLGALVDASVARYEREDMCDSPANETIGWRDPGFVHDGVMVGLMKGKKYYYKVGSDSKGWSMTYSFVSRDEESDGTIAFLFGDMGTSAPYSTFVRTQEESLTTVKLILRDIEALGDKPAFVSHIGDISYARGYSWLWDIFFNQIEPLASRVPYHVCIGNHEYDWPTQPWKPDWASSIYGKDGGGECGVPYSLKFNMPGKYSEPTGTRAPATRNLFYSFNKGAVHFVYISTETNFLIGSPQYELLSHDLENVNRTKTPFVVVQGHRPMYTTSHESRDTTLRAKMLEHLEPLFVKNQVTLAFWGHVHRYERFCSLSNFTCGNTDGKISDKWPVHVVIGMAGQDWQPVWQPREDHLTDPIFPQPKHSLYRGGEFGYTRLVANKEKLTLSYVGNHDGGVHDMVEILASGQIINGGSEGAGKAAPVVKDEVVESRFSWYVMGASVLVLGAFLGYVLGCVAHTRREAALGKKWTPVISDEN